MAKDSWASEEHAEASIERTEDHVHLDEGRGRCMFCGINLAPAFDEHAHRRQAKADYYSGRRGAVHPDQDPCSIDPLDPVEV